MREICAAALLSAACIVSLSSASAGADDLRASLQSRYAAMKAAMASHDHAALAAILAPGFTSVDVSGHAQDASELMAEVDALKPDPNKSSETKLLDVRSDGTTATVQQRYDMKTTKIGGDGAKHSVELITLSTDTWLRYDEGWQLKETVTDELSYFMDGQLVTHKTKP